MGLFGFGKYSDRAVAKTTASEGFRPATREEKYGAFAPLKFNVEYMPEQGRLAELEPLFLQAWQSKERLPSGTRVYAALLEWVHADSPEGPNDIAEYLAPFEAEFQRDPSSFTAALYAHALHHAAFAARGRAFADDTSPQQWSGYAALTSQATDVLFSVANVADDDAAWWDTRYAISQSDGTSGSEREQILSTLIALDEGNNDTFATAMLFALPRWFGESAQDADLVAHRARAAMEAEWGAGGYSLAYYSLTGTGGHEVDDTVMDVTLAEQGFRDLMARNPSIAIQNAFARTMSWANAESVVNEIFDSGLRAIDPVAWDGDDEEEGVALATRAYMWARNNG